MRQNIKGKGEKVCISPEPLGLGVFPETGVAMGTHAGAWNKAEWGKPMELVEMDKNGFECFSKTVSVVLFYIFSLRKTIKY